MRTLAPLLLLVAACSDAPATGDSAADLDSAVDAALDAPADAGRDGWVVETLGDYTVAHHVLSTEPCAPWAPIDVPPRGLPTDTTPRILWTWAARDEPRLGILAWWDLGQLTLRPTGGVVVRAAQATMVARLGRDGTVENVMGALAAGALAVLPDDQTAVFESRVASDTFGLLVLGGDAYELPMHDLGGGGVQPLTTTEYGEVVYHPAPGMLNVACGADGRARSETEITIDGRPLRVSWLQTNSAGQIIVNPKDHPLPSDDPLILALPGHPVAVVDSWRREGWEMMWVVAGPSATELTGTGLRGDGGPVGRLDEGEFSWTSELLGSRKVLLLPDSRLWAANRQVATLLRGPEPQITIDSLRRYDIVGEDGSIIGGLRDQPEILVRILPDGTEAWRIELSHGVSPDAFGMVLNDQGVLYALQGNSIVAVQTDVLPPPGCFRLQCNHQRNGWAGPTRE